MKKVDLEVQGMSCGHCVKAVEDALKPLDGVRRYEVAIGKVSVECDEHVTRDAIVAAIQDAGYEVG